MEQSRKGTCKVMLLAAEPINSYGGNVHEISTCTFFHPTVTKVNTGLDFSQDMCLLNIMTLMTIFFSQTNGDRFLIVFRLCFNFIFQFLF